MESTLYGITPIVTQSNCNKLSTRSSPGSTSTLANDERAFTAFAGPSPMISAAAGLIHSTNSTTSPSSRSCGQLLTQVPSSIMMPMSHTTGSLSLPMSTESSPPLLSTMNHLMFDQFHHRHHHHHLNKTQQSKIMTDMTFRSNRLVNENNNSDAVDLTKTSPSTY
ncbi:hypothetical protein BLA29_008550 [Euroglyphus maynei]|uniref:Uncharacterized protein n=1 Tax=Euroglyphus maynei TaxID=6958 RepID=A0A1Y3B311_EURMA|nr:hypothetical protein BLA29_008550 [Euroglyphus maynei]